MRPRTLEEAIAYENFPLLRTGALSIGIPIPGTLSEAYQIIYDRIRSDDFKKTDFAMSLLASKETWNVPAYIAEGLRWLETRLCDPVPIVGPMQAAKTIGEVSA
jgi:putative ATP-dependent endonuclease of the OLD family